MPQSVSRFFAQFAPIFRPPFEGLWVCVLIYYAWCFFVFPHSETLRGNLPDPDDYMYLTQVLDWIKGQGWYDNIQHRMNPPTGTPIHFSRFAMMPMAIMVMIFRQFGFAMRGAATLMALIEPLALFGILMVTLRWVCECFMSKNWAGVSAYVTLFATGMTFMFMPGHVDHHGMIIVIVAAALGCILRMVQHPDQTRWGIYAGLALAFGLTVALEILPWLLLFSALLGLWAIVKGRDAARNAMVYGFILYLASAVLLALTRPPKTWMELDVLTYSVVYIYLTGGIAIAFIGAGLTANAPVWLRGVVGGGLAAIAGFVFLRHFPSLVAGPYGGMDPELAEQILGEIDEAQSLLTIDKSVFLLLYHTAGGLVALGTAIGFLKQTFKKPTGPERAEALWLWGIVTSVLLAALLLTVFYQRRFTGVMGMASIIPMTVLVEYGWNWIGVHYQGRRKVWAEIFLVLLVGPLPSVLIPALIDGRPFNTGFLLFPVDTTENKNPCDTYILEKILRDPEIYGDRPRLIISSMGLGPELLFRTPHMILSAPYHMNVTGNIDATRFFSTPYASEAESIARRRKADLIVACRYVPEIYLRTPESTIVNEAHPKDFAPHFIELLMTGKAPAWVKPVSFKGLDNFMIFEILPSADQTATQKTSPADAMPDAPASPQKPAEKTGAIMPEKPFAPTAAPARGELLLPPNTSPAQPSPQAETPSLGMMPGRSDR